MAIKDHIKTDMNTHIIIDGTEQFFFGVFAKCLSNETRIRRPRGMIKLGDMKDFSKRMILSYNLKDKKLEKDYAVKIPTGKKQIFEIETEKGKTIKASEDHIFFIKEKEKIVERKLKDLMEGDELVILNDHAKIPDEKIKSIKKLGIEETSDLIVEKNKNFVIDNGILVHNSGHGKTLACQSLMECFHDIGYTVLILNDVKNSFEMGFCLFEPRKKYHLDALRHDGKPIETKKLRIHHPFTFRVPNNKLPEIEFYSFPMGEMGRAEMSILSESPYESETMRLLLNASENLKNSEGIYQFVHNIEANVMGKKKDKTKVKPDPNLFNLRVTSASQKGLQEVASYLLPFKKDYFLHANNSELNLDWNQILNDNEHYHLFTTKWIKDDKIKHFCILNLLEGIVRNVDLARKPILIVINEIRYLTPERSKGYQEFLASAISKRLSTLRNMGRGFSGIFDSQVFSDISSDVKQSFNVNVFGELGSPVDIDRLSKHLKYKRDIVDQLKHMEDRNSYLIQGLEDLESFTMFMPGHCNAEAEYKFEEEYKKHFPNKMQSYKPLKEKKKKQFDEEKKEINKKIKAREKEEQKEEDEKEEAKEEKKNKSEKVEEKEEEIKALKEEKKEDKMKRAYELKQEGLSLRKIAEKIGTTHKTVSKYLKAYEPIKQQEDSKDFEDTFMQGEGIMKEETQTEEKEIQEEDEVDE